MIQMIDLYLAFGVLAGAFVGKWLLYQMHSGGASFDLKYLKPALWGAAIAILGGSPLLSITAPDASIEGKILAGVTAGWALVGGPNTREIQKWLTKLFNPIEVTK
jgi:hypothetical protein